MLISLVVSGCQMKFRSVIFTSNHMCTLFHEVNWMLLQIGMVSFSLLVTLYQMLVMEWFGSIMEEMNFMETKNVWIVHIAR